MSDLGRLTKSLAKHYRIERELGAGGMATVYLAHDVKHDRKVAIKVLKPELAAVLGADRFVLEIKTTASLQHPHIVPLFDSGTADGFLFYVMPYITAETIREKLNRETQCGVEEAVRIAREVADALDYAHRCGVIHRDIKPENILLHDGRAMVMDFGIALAVSAAAGGRLTETGLSLGTPHYMSPEQATGEREITPRADLYSLASVLYEMLAGQPPHLGGSAQQIIMKIITEPVQPVTVLRKSVPPNVAAAVAKALEKLPADRFESAKAFGDALGNAGFTTTRNGDGASGSYAGRGRTYRRLFIAATVAAVSATTALAWACLRSRGAELTRPVRFVLTFPPSAPLLEGPGSPLVLSPDGRTLVYRTEVAGSSMLYRRVLDQLVPVAIAGTERAVMPFFSPDGKWLGYFTGTELRKLPADGGPPATVSSVRRPEGATWGPADLIVLGSYPGVDGLSKLSLTDGAPLPFTKPDLAKGELSHRWPRLLADGKTVLYTSWGSGGLKTARIGIASLKTGESTILPIVGSYPFGVVDGQLIYLRADGALMAAPVDIGRRRATGDPVVLVEGVSIETSGAPSAALSANGVLTYVTGSNSARLVLVGAGGVARTLVAEKRDYDSPRFSPDGGRIAVAIDAPPSDIWVYDLAAGSFVRLTAEAVNLRPEWSADGKRIVFLSNRSGEFAPWWRASDGSAALQKVFEDKDDALEMTVSRDGSVLLYRGNQNGGSYGLRFGSLDDATKPKPFVATSSYHEMMPSLAPDGRWLAFVSDESGTMAVYVRPFPGPAAQYLVSVDGGSEPHWSPDGRRLFYRHGAKMLAATITTVPAFSVTRRDLLFEGRFATSLSHQNYDVTPDGQGFLMLQRETDAEVVVVLNWLTEARTRIRASARK